MRKNTKKLFLAGWGLLALFALFTGLIRLADVRPAGPAGAEVGLAALNSRFHAWTGVHMRLYHLTDWLGLVPVMICLLFAGLGFAQLVGRKSLRRVDGDLLLLGAYYAAVILFSPLFLAVAVAIKLDDGGRVFFRQKRATIDGRVFEIFKFRTMTASACQAQQQVSASQADQRITRVGRFLRKIRVDELPQLLNVIKGDMSLVGPRPEMLENVAKYKKELPAFVYREKMKAGITGYAQIEGKYNTTPQDKLMLDLTYIESYSICLDIKLLFRTLTVFFKPDSTEGFEAAVPQENQKAAQG